jgi:16S rRNA processing protein RimM
MAAPEFVIVGRVRRAHGIRGEVVIEPLTDAPDAVFASGARVFVGTVDGDITPDRRTLTVAESRPFKEGLLVRFAEIPTRTDAERWRERYMLLPADELEPPGEDEVYIHDLLGLRVDHVDGSHVGEVLATYDMPQGIMLEVKRASGTVLIPFRPELIASIDVEAGLLVIDPPEGLLE